MVRPGRFLRALAAALACALLLLPTAALAAQPKVVRSPQKLTVDGLNVACEKYNIDDYNYFKLRDLACLLSGTGSQFSVGYDDATRTVTVVTGQPYAKQSGDLELGADKSATAVRSSQSIRIDGVAYTGLNVFNIGGVNGNNYFKLAEIGPILGFDVSYDAASNTAQITSRAKSANGQPASTARLGQTADAGRDYLDRIIFLGDSTTYGIGVYYKMGYTALCPSEQVWTPKSGWMGLHQVEDAKIWYHATGEELLIRDAVAKAKPDILLVTLGIDSIALIGKDDFVRYYTTLIDAVKAASLDTKIILNSIYPVADSYKYKKDINNDKINAANGWIEDLAVSSGCRFLYSWEALAVNGRLPETMQNGDGLHLNGEAFTKVMQYIRTHAYA